MRATGPASSSPRPTGTTLNSTIMRPSLSVLVAVLLRAGLLQPLLPGDEAVVEDGVALVDAAGDLGDMGGLGPELLDGVDDGLVGLGVGAAGVDVERGVAHLRPGVGRDVGFRDDDDAADARRREFAERDR